MSWLLKIKILAEERHDIGRKAGEIEGRMWFDELW